MFKSPLFTLAAPIQHLRQLMIIRCLLLFFLWGWLLLSARFFDIAYHYLVALLLVLSVINGLTFMRLKNPLKVTNAELFGQLLVDVIGLNIFFYFSGGANNPFISYLLVPICISAATLPWRFTWLITIFCVCAYTLLLFFHVEFSMFAVNHHDQGRFNWHILGMWVNFFISAILITYFVVKMAQTLRDQDKALSRLREDELRNEQLMAVAMLAAGAAHEINTPLSTMSILLAELLNDYKENENLHEDLILLRQQVDHCAGTLKQMVSDSALASKGQFKSQPIDAFCKSIIDRWQLMRPTVTFHVDYKGSQLGDIYELDPRLDQAIINLLNNAADASPKDISISISCHDQLLEWRIADTGSGIQKDVSESIGRIAYSTKENGLGLGMVLTHATISNYGGKVYQIPNSPQGTITLITIPLHKF